MYPSLHVNGNEISGFFDIPGSMQHCQVLCAQLPQCVTAHFVRYGWFDNDGFDNDEFCSLRNSTALEFPDSVHVHREGTFRTPTYFQRTCA